MRSRGLGHGFVVGRGVVAGQGERHHDTRRDQRTGGDTDLHRHAHALRGRRTACRARAARRAAARHRRARDTRRARSRATGDERGDLGVPGGTEPADDRDRHDGGDAARDLGDLAGREAALGALLQVLAQPAFGTGAQPAAGIGAELVGVAGALLVVGEGGTDVGLEIGLLEALAGAAGEHTRAVGVEPEEGGDIARRLVLDLGVPQHGLPALGQRPEGLHGHGLLGHVHGAHIGAQVQRVVVGDIGHARGLCGEHREVVDQLLPLG